VSDLSAASSCCERRSFEFCATFLPVLTSTTVSASVRSMMSDHLRAEDLAIERAVQLLVDEVALEEGSSSSNVVVSMRWRVRGDRITYSRTFS